MFINLCEPISAVEKSPYSGMQYTHSVVSIFIPHVFPIFPVNYEFHERINMRSKHNAGKSNILAQAEAAFVQSVTN